MSTSRKVDLPIVIALRKVGRQSRGLPQPRAVRTAKARPLLGLGKEWQRKQEEEKRTTTEHGARNSPISEPDRDRVKRDAGTVRPARASPTRIYGVDVAAA